MKNILKVAKGLCLKASASPILVNVAIAALLFGVEQLIAHYKAMPKQEYDMAQFQALLNQAGVK